MVGPALFVVHPLFPVLAYCLASLAGQLDRWALDQVLSWASEGAAPLPAWDAGPAHAVEAPPALVTGGLALDEAQARRLEEGYQVQTVINALINAGITSAIVLVVGHYYNQNVTEERGPFSVNPHFSLSGGRGFAYPWYDIFGDMTYCCFGFCCQQERTADTYATAEVVTFWTMLIVAVLFLFFNSMITLLLAGLFAEPQYAWPSVLATYLGGGVWACYLATKRQKLRMKLGGTPDSASLVQDCLCYWWCNCCTIIQDARQVDGATDTRVACCCNLMQANSPQRVHPTGGGGRAPQQVVGKAVGAPNAGKAWR